MYTWINRTVPDTPLELRCNSKSWATIEAVDSNDENICDPLTCGNDASAGRITQTNSSSSSSAADAAHAAAAEWRVVLLLLL